MRSVLALCIVGSLAGVTVGSALVSLPRRAPAAVRSDGPVAPWSPARGPTSAELTEQIRAAESRVNAKRAIAAGLVRGELTTERAAARCREILDDEPTVLTRLRETYPAAADDEIALRQVIIFVRLVAPPDSERAAAVLYELEWRVQTSPPRRKLTPG
jgi:hypothetical protein